MSRKECNARRFICLAMTVAVASFGLLTAGCNRTQTGKEALQKQLAANGQTLTTISKFSGKVTIDGNAPDFGKSGQMLLIMLYDPNSPPSSQSPLQRATVDKKGEFAFQTYDKGDGAKAGSYIVLFTAMKPHRGGAFSGPDGLNNLYNDPDENKKNASFQVDLTGPGCTDCSFDLVLAGHSPAEPGPRAVTKIDRGS
jgi:hypothetical protein